jgi:hypothetical protein
MERKYNQGVADSNRKRVLHGATVDARQGKATRTYKIWVGIKQRCFNPNTEHYERYGGRGITMHKTWADDYAAFLADVGEPPKGMTLERIDNSGNYEPNNVRWATRKEQANNRDTNVFITYRGETKTLMQWAEHLGWKYGLIASRWKKGVRGDALFAAPEYKRGALHEYKGRIMTLPEWVKETGVPYATLKWRIKHGKDLL